MDKFVEITSKNRNHQIEKEWFNHCQIRQIPYITVTTRRKYAIVQWDHIAYPMSMDKTIFSQKDAIKEKAFTIFDKYCLPKSEAHIGPGIISYWDLEIAAAKKAAFELYDVIDNSAHKTLSTSQ